MEDSDYPRRAYVARQDMSVTIAGDNTQVGSSERTSTSPTDVDVAKKPSAAADSGHVPEPVLVRSLLGVLPETRTGRLRLLSIELWSSGFSIRYAWYSDRESARVPTSDSSGWRWDVFDDRGREYTFTGASSRLVHPSLETGEWRFAPALDAQTANVSAQARGTQLFSFAVTILPQ